MDIQAPCDPEEELDDNIEAKDLEYIGTDDGQVMYFVSMEQDDEDEASQTGEEINTLSVYSNGDVDDTSENNVITLEIDNHVPVIYDARKLTKRRRSDHVKRKTKKIRKTAPKTNTNDNVEQVEPKPKERHPGVSQKTKMLHTIRSLSEQYQPELPEILQAECTKVEKEDTDLANVVYRVVYPDELDLKPSGKVPQKKGRPRKKTNLLNSENESNTQAKTAPAVKNVRTRSGRITRPPNHIKNDFEKIDTSESSTNQLDFKTVEFEPLKTNQEPTAKDVPVKTDQLEHHARKRSIASQYRCPKCKKAYLGHSKMLKHLEQFPDHGPIPEHCKIQGNETWNFLIDISKKSPAGQRGLKFCRELITLLENVRILAKVLFKHPNSTDKNLYFVDRDLGGLLGMETGNYILNESELHKEVHIFSYIREMCRNESFLLDSRNIEKPCVENERSSVIQNEIRAQNLENTSQVQDNNKKLNSKKNNDALCNNLKSDAVDNTKPQSSLMELNFNAIQNANHSDFNLNCSPTPAKIQNLTFDHELEILNEFHSDTIQKNGKKNSLENCNSLTVLVDNHQNALVKDLHSDLGLHNELLSESSLLNSLPNLRATDDELILTNVESTHVTNLLDNITGSDEVINVDQFVNERFKKLTEPELELPNTSLHLDLPTLDLFQFNTS